MCVSVFCSGGSFLGKVGGHMSEVNLTELRKTLVKGVRMIVAIRRLAMDVGLDRPELADLEREVRAAAGEVYLVEKEMWSEGPRPHVRVAARPDPAEIRG